MNDIKTGDYVIFRRSVAGKEDTYKGVVTSCQADTCTFNVAEKDHASHANEYEIGEQITIHKTRLQYEGTGAAAKGYSGPGGSALGAATGGRRRTKRLRRQRKTSKKRVSRRIRLSYP